MRERQRVRELERQCWGAGGERVTGEAGREKRWWDTGREGKTFQKFAESQAAVTGAAAELRRIQRGTKNDNVQIHFMRISPTNSGALKLFLVNILKDVFLLKGRL